MPEQDDEAQSHEDIAKRCCMQWVESADRDHLRLQPEQTRMPRQNARQSSSVTKMPDPMCHP